MTTDPNRNVVTFDVETWGQGTAGWQDIRGLSGTNRAFIQNAVLNQSGLLVPRQTWKRWGYNSAGDTYLNIPNSPNLKNPAIFPVATAVNEAGQVTNAIVVIDNDGAVLYEAKPFLSLPGGVLNDLGTVAAPTSAAQAGQAEHHTYTQHDRFQYLLADNLITTTTDPGTLAQFSAQDSLGNLESTFDPTNDLSLAACRSTIHQGRAYYWGKWVDNGTFYLEPSRRGMIMYSDPYDYTTFSSSTQFFQVEGDIDGVAGIGANLFIWTEAGEWYILQGRGEPKRGVLHTLGKFSVPAWREQVGILDNRLVFLNQEGFPCFLSADGEMDDYTLRYLKYHSGVISLTNPKTTRSPAAVNNILNCATMPVDNTITTTLSLRSGIWTYETFDGLFNNYATIRSSLGSNVEWAFNPVERSPGVYEHEVYYRSYLGQAPTQRTDSENMEPNMTSIVRLPTLRLPTQNIRITRVTLDVATWDILNTDPLSMTVTAETLVDDSTTVTFVEAGSSKPLSSPNDDGNIRFRRLEFRPPNPLPMASMAQIVLEFTGVGIHSATVEYETSNRRTNR